MTPGRMSSGREAAELRRRVADLDLKLCTLNHVEASLIDRGRVEAR
jgi:hypothetical protein